MMLKISFCKGTDEEQRVLEGESNEHGDILQVHIGFSQ